MPKVRRRSLAIQSISEFRLKSSLPVDASQTFAVLSQLAVRVNLTCVDLRSTAVTGVPGCVSFRWILAPIFTSATAALGSSLPFGEESLC